MLAWASIYNQYGEQYGKTLDIEGVNVYEEIESQLTINEEIADYGVYEEEN